MQMSNDYEQGLLKQLMVWDGLTVDTLQYSLMATNS
jgi:hypothetical protein